MQCSVIHFSLISSLKGISLWLCTSLSHQFQLLNQLTNFHKPLVCHWRTLQCYTFYLLTLTSNYMRNALNSEVEMTLVTITWRLEMVHSNRSLKSKRLLLRWNNNMTAESTFSSALSLITRTNEPLALGLWSLIWKYKDRNVYMLIWNFEVMSDIFNAYRICTK